MTDEHYSAASAEFPTPPATPEPVGQHTFIGHASFQRLDFPRIPNARALTTHELDLLA